MIEPLTEGYGRSNIKRYHIVGTAYFLRYLGGNIKKRRMKYEAEISDNDVSNEQ